MNPIRTELLNDEHERGEFSCGNPTLDSFLAKMAKQHSKKGVSRTYVALPPDSRSVIGYFTIVASSVAFEEFPEPIRKKLPFHPVPTILLARLAIDGRYQGQGLGRTLLFDALQRSVTISESLGVFAVNVSAIDDKAIVFYSRYGFLPLPNQPNQLFMSMDNIRREFS